MVTVLNLYNSTILVATCICALHFLKNERPKEQFLIFSFICVGLIVEVYGKFLGSQGFNNNWLYNALFVHVQTGLVLTYIGLTSQFIRLKKYLILIFSLLLIFSIFNAFFFQNPLKIFQLYSFRLGSFTIICASLFYFYRINFKGLHENENLLTIPSFWANSFFLFFYSGSFLYFSSIYFFFEMDAKLVKQLNNILKLLGSIMYLGLSFSFFASSFDKEKSINQPIKEK